ncbi:MAG: hypothetical protein QOJ31_381 [Gaiellales bacterium]|jgi:hypothetical protein|nr:hypothetical protein [Gaiellales bacterium]MDX6545372.1 hypothetical protein [Gaiellales bacterium]MDX6549697.1 hypothetical protein [Gaiellales bacterium]
MRRFIPKFPMFFTTVVWNVASLRRRGEHDVVDRVHTSHAAHFGRK